MAKKKQPKLERKVEQRILQFVNAARCPQDLTARPDRPIRIHAEHRGTRRPEVPEEHHDHEEEPFLDLEVAARLIERRDESNPIHGFVNLRELLAVEVLAALPDRFIWAFSAAVRGNWDGPFDIPAGHDRPIHAAMLRSGKVLFIGLPNGDVTTLWQPSATGAGTFTHPSVEPGDSLFCSGHSFLSDGRLLVVGGGGDGTGPRHNRGWIFDPDPATEAWVQTQGNGTPLDGDMAFPRWYPTLVTMGDEPGRVLVVSGDDTSGTPVEQMEVYFETTDRFEKVWGPGGLGDTSANRSFPQIYPGMHLLPGGEALYAPTGWHSGGSFAADFPAAKPSAYFEFDSTSVPVRGSWHDVGTADVAAEDAIDRVKGMSVFLFSRTYPFVRAMIVGGGADPMSTTSYQIVNLSTFHPQWSHPLPLPDGLARVNVNLVLLPDQRLFLCGGRPVEGAPANGGECWIYDPAADSWHGMDALARERRYHSMALLLPDARVAVAGNESTNDRTIEIFSPPYLFNPDGTTATRPAIDSAPALVHHGHSFAIESPQADCIRNVVLVRPMAVTHQTDSEQRVLPLTFARTGGTTLTATAPDGWHPHALAPRGWYMLFILDDRGVPSVAHFMMLH